MYGKPGSLILTETTLNQIFKAYFTYWNFLFSWFSKIFYVPSSWPPDKSLNYLYFLPLNLSWLAERALNSSSQNYLYWPKPCYFYNSLFHSLPSCHALALHQFQYNCYTRAPLIASKQEHLSHSEIPQSGHGPFLHCHSSQSAQSIVSVSHQVDAPQEIQSCVSHQHGKTFKSDVSNQVYCLYTSGCTPTKCTAWNSMLELQNPISTSRPMHQYLQEHPILIHFTLKLKKLRLKNQYCPALFLLHYQWKVATFYIPYYGGEYLWFGAQLLGTKDEGQIADFNLCKGREKMQIHLKGSSHASCVARLDVSRYYL